jgi:protein-S-isoprenylcysteine O-methyltransferase Ste14
MNQESRKIFPPTIFYTLAIAIIILWVLFPNPILFNLPFNLLGILFISCGIFLNIWTDSSFKRYNTTVKPNETPSKLITTGPFYLCKHPKYIGMGLILVGESILLGSLVTFLIPIIFIFCIRKLFIPFEERTLQTWFPDEYEQYEKKMRWRKVL